MALQSEFSRIIEINESLLDKKLSVSAEQEELSKIADRFALHSIKFMQIDYIISNKDAIKNTYDLTCTLHAEIVKFIIENTEEKMLLNETFDIVLIDEENLKKNEEILKEEDIEIIDLSAPKIDIGEIGTQYLSLFVYM